MDDRSLDRLTRFRRDLHRIPELDRDLPKTVEYVKNALSELRCTVFSPAQSAVCAYFDCGKEDTVAFRSDMDALPVTETSDCDFASAHPGCMHACGHDGHMALVLELAHSVDRLAPDLPHNVLLIFQPAEETTGGARYICESGVFERYRVSHIFGTHLWPALPAGEVVTRSGPMLAKSSEVNVTVTGKSAHIARAWEGRDALLAGMDFLKKAYDMVEREVPPEEPRLLRFGRFDSGTARNALSAETRMMGSLRSFTPETFDFMKRRLLEIASNVEEETGCSVTIDINEGYPPVINDPTLYDRVKAFLGGDMPGVTEPFMIAEDFSFYGLRVPSLFFLLGTGTEEPLHSDKFHFDESVLLSGLRLYERLLYL